MRKKKTRYEKPPLGKYSDENVLLEQTYTDVSKQQKVTVVVYFRYSRHGVIEQMYISYTVILV